VTVRRLAASPNRLLYGGWPTDKVFTQMESVGGLIRKLRKSVRQQTNHLAGEGERFRRLWLVALTLL
jgi:hypothetical protein